MTELIILTAFAPLIFLPFPAFRSLTQVWGWTAIAIAALCNGYFIFLHAEEPLLWVPVGAFLSVFFVNLVGQRYRRGLSTLAVLFVSQALLSNNLGYVLVLLALADTFLGAELFLSSKIEEKNRAVQSLYQSAVSLLPAALGLLLRLDGDALVACVAATIVLRLFSWPVSQWIVEISGNNKMFPTFVGLVSSFALWHIQIFPKPELWATIWLCLALFFSLGAKYTEMFAALSLGLYALSPSLGIFSVCLWPLLARPSFTIYVVALLTAALGALVSDGVPHVLIPEASFVVAGIAGIALARVFAGTKIIQARWYLLALDAAFSILWIGLFGYFNPVTLNAPGPTALTFAGAFVFTFLVGKLVHNKKPKMFRALSSLSPQVFSRDLMGADFLAEKRGGPIEFGPSRFRVRFFESVESEAYVVFLFGVLGALLLWGLK